MTGVEGGDHLVADHGIECQPRLDRELVGVDSRKRLGQVKDVHLG